MKQNLCILILSFLMAGCANSLMEQTKNRLSFFDETISIKQSLDIAEATFRYQFEYYSIRASRQNQGVPVYFLSLFGKDPTTKFMGRFTGEKLIARMGSEFEIGKGFFLSISNIKRVTEDKVEVAGGYFAEELCASGNTYILKKINGKWIVTESILDWIS